MQAIISDVTGQTVPKELSYKLEIYSRSTGLRLEMDLENHRELMNFITLARKNGQQWKKLVKDENTGKWSKVPVETEPLQ